MRIQSTATHLQTLDKRIIASSTWNDVPREPQELFSNRFSNIRALSDYEWTKTRARDVSCTAQYHPVQRSEKSGNNNTDVLGL